MRGRQSVVVSASNITMQAREFSKFQQKALIDGKFKPNLSDSLPTVFLLVNMVKTL
jgi:hypothetical protein